MGMFDDVKCEVPLPDGYNGEWFQTKDFECSMLDKYVIRADGRLLRYDEDTNFHGILNFYDLKNGVWHEYNAKFTDGKLIEIVHVPDDDIVSQ